MQCIIVCFFNSVLLNPPRTVYRVTIYIDAEHCAEEMSGTTDLGKIGTVV